MVKKYTLSLFALCALPFAHLAVKSQQFECEDEDRFAEDEDEFAIKVTSSFFRGTRAADLPPSHYLALNGREIQSFFQIPSSYIA